MGIRSKYNTFLTYQAYGLKYINRQSFNVLNYLLTGF